MAPVKISIVVPTYNRSKLLQRTLDSLMGQTEVPDEIIVVDDGSKDNTGDLVARYTGLYPPLRYVKLARNQGAPHARNRGIALAQGDFVLLLDSDNELVAGYCERAKRYLAEYPSVDILTHFSSVVNESGHQQAPFTWITRGDILKDILVLNTYVDNSSALIRKEKLLQIGPLDEKCPSFQEWDTHIRLAEVSQYGCLEEPLTLYHRHGEERISGDRTLGLEGRYYILQKHRALWLGEVGMRKYLEQLFLTYEMASDQKQGSMSAKLADEMKVLDPQFFRLRHYRRLGSKIKGRILHRKGR